MCNCYSKLNEQLEQYNTRLNATIGVVDNTMKFVGVRIETVKADSSKRGKPTSVTASYCPFCGQKYEGE